MKKLSFVFILLALGLVSKSYAQLPGNPANPHGTMINDGIGLAKWEKVADSLYFEFTITTPATFIPAPNSSYLDPYIEFWGYDHDVAVHLPGSMTLTWNASNFPGGTHTYYGVIDITGWDPDWTDIQADYLFYTGSPSSPTTVESDFLIDPSFWYPWPQ